MIKSNNFYHNKSSTYYTNARTEIMPLLPDRVDRVLEIGCAEGGTLLWVRQQKGCVWLGGVELFESAVVKARQQLDWVDQGNIETMELPFEPKSLDLILCLDVLEHLWDPWSVVQRLSTLLKHGGTLIISVPNFRHHSVLYPLLIKGRLDYAVEGVLDKTHVRFFSKSTAIELAQSGGLTVDMVLATGLPPGSKSALANMITFGVFSAIFEWQYLIRAVKL